MAPRPSTHYETLGVSRQATSAEIRTAYRTAARRLHPDAGGSPAGMRDLNAAWQVLRDPGRRAAYDRTLSGDGFARAMPQYNDDQPLRSDDWYDAVADLLDDEPIRPVRAPEGWSAIAPPAALVFAIALLGGAFIFSSSTLFVFSVAMFFVAVSLFILAPLRAMTRPR